MRFIRHILMSLLVLLPASSFSFKDHLNNEIDKGTVSEWELDFAVQQKMPKALEKQLTQLKVGSVGWLSVMSRLGDTQENFAYELSQYYLRKANNEQYLYWLGKASSQSSHQATIDLANYYYVNQHTDLVLETINKALHDNRLVHDVEPEPHIDTLLTIKLKALLALGDVKQIQALQRTISQTPAFKQSSQLLIELQQYQVYSTPRDEFTIALPDIGSCGRTITLVATTYEDLKQLADIKKEYAAHPFNQFICIQGIVYRPIGELNCNDDMSVAIMCDESYWQHHTKLITSDYIGVMLPKGGANVHFGVMYFDRHDTFNVFIHELSHLIGFVDEYALSVTHIACQTPTGGKGLNISLLQKRFKKTHSNQSLLEQERQSLREKILNNVPWRDQIEVSTAILSEHEDYWLVGTPQEQRDKVGLFYSETCLNDDYVSVKPRSQATFLRHTGEIIPLTYLTLLQTQQYQYAMPLYYYNIAISLLRQDKDEVAQYWLSKALFANKKRLN